jgi:RHS repeat-associated protein
VIASYGYDNASRLTSITRGSNVFGFGYDTVNRRTSLSHPNGINTTYSYDTLSRLTGIQAVKDLQAISTFTYGYDDVGNRTSKNVGDHLENYGYDGLDRLTSVSRTGVGENTWRFGYDAVGNRTSTQVGSGEVVSPTFNNRNQLQQQAVGGALVVEGTLDEESAVSVNGAPARMVTPTHFEATIQSSPGTNAFTVAATDLSGNVRTDDYEVAVSGTASSYGYDAAGNLISKTLPGETWTYSWNALNQLTSASRNGALQASFQYDPLGRRVVKSTPAKVTTYTYDGADILRENVTAGWLTTTSYYVHGPSIDEPLGKETGGVMTYYHADGLGSIVKETSAAGAVTNTLRYDAWGNIEAGARDGFAFTGREWDPETGLYYYRARYYDLRAGRFISEDPIGFGGGLNWYSYAFGSPTRWRDPSGLDVTITITRDTTTSVSVGSTVDAYSDKAKKSFSGFAIEDAVGGTSRNKPPVDVGAYDAFLRKDRAPNRVELVGVPNYANVQIHIGNTAADVEGCFAVGTARGPDFVTGSRQAMAGILDLIAADGTGNIRVLVQDATPQGGPASPPTPGPFLSRVLAAFSRLIPW